VREGKKGEWVGEVTEEKGVGEGGRGRGCRELGEWKVVKVVRGVVESWGSGNR